MAACPLMMAMARGVNPALVDNGNSFRPLKVAPIQISDVQKVLDEMK